MRQADTIRFRLDGVDVTQVNGALIRGEPIYGYTNYELYIIVSFTFDFNRNSKNTSKQTKTKGFW